MVRSKKSLKLDRAKIALGQAHERYYLKQIAKEQLGNLNRIKKPSLWLNVGKSDIRLSVAKLTRITKALLKCLK